VSFNGAGVGLDLHAPFGGLPMPSMRHGVGWSGPRLCPDHGETLHWVHRLRGPVWVAYKAGPTGFGDWRGP
jgi:transposase